MSRILRLRGKSHKYIYLGLDNFWGQWLSLSADLPPAEEEAKLLADKVGCRTVDRLPVTPRGGLRGHHSQ